MTRPDPDDLKSAAAVALGLLTIGMQAIDHKFGEGYAADNSVLLAAFMRTASSHYQPSRETPQQESPRE